MQLGLAMEQMEPINLNLHQWNSGPDIAQDGMSKQMVL